MRLVRCQSSGRSRQSEQERKTEDGGEGMRVQSSCSPQPLLYLTPSGQARRPCDDTQVCVIPFPCMRHARHPGYVPTHSPAATAVRPRPRSCTEACVRCCASYRAICTADRPCVVAIAGRRSRSSRPHARNMAMGALRTVYRVLRVAVLEVWHAVLSIEVQFASTLSLTSQAGAPFPRHGSPFARRTARPNRASGHPTVRAPSSFPRVASQGHEHRVPQRWQRRVPSTSRPASPFARRCLGFGPGLATESETGTTVPDCDTAGG